MSMRSEYEQRYVQAVAKASKSTVSVRAAGSFGPPCGPRAMRWGGSGIVLDDRGHILTNAHVVAKADRIMVLTNDGTVHTGEVVGSDPTVDIAVVKIGDLSTPPAAMGDSDELQVGQPILCIGNPLGLSGGPTVTSGIVSCLCRNLIMGRGEGLPVIQTDAPVNPGSSGGPLVDLDGQVMAITVAQIPYAEGMGFAIPINLARSIAQQLIEKGKVQRAWLGITAHDVDMRMAYHFRLPDTCGAFITEVTRQGPAEGAGLRMGDVIVKLNGRMLGGVSDLLAVLGGLKTGDGVEVEVRRNGRTEKYQVTLGERPY
jgi:serine protease Do